MVLNDNALFGDQPYDRDVIVSITQLPNLAFDGHLSEEFVRKHNKIDHPIDVKMSGLQRKRTPWCIPTCVDTRDRFNGTRFGVLFAFLLFHWNKLLDGIVSQICDLRMDCSQF